MMGAEYVGFVKEAKFNKLNQGLREGIRREYTLLTAYLIRMGS